VQNDVSDDFIDFHQTGNRVSGTDINVLSAGGATSFTAVDLTSAIPDIAKSATGFFTSDDPNLSLSILTIASNSAGTLGVLKHGSRSQSVSGETAPFNSHILTSQTIWYQMVDSDENGFINVSGWEY